MADDEKRDPAEYDGLYMARRHFEDDWTIGEVYATREEAIDAYADDHGAMNGETFATAKLAYERETPALPYDAEDMIDRAADVAYHDWSESTHEAFCDAADKHKEELQHRLEQVWQQWCEKHNLCFEGYKAVDEQTHVVGQDESEKELARRKLADAVAEDEDAAG